ncbi:MAG: preprotein translocase subunit SecA [Pelagibacteraceae bacterium TMED237]|nr:MAG: preprotein translocase subunit SecA [Pelagibacteraceae bacterium TMED237]|tara:strand:+ start:3212 stop:5728 length:2517 start_codon:yes stop_codon:yes gene_type:complete
MINIVNKLFNSISSKSLKNYNSLISNINNYENDLSALSDEELKYKTKFFKLKLENGEKLENILPEAFAVVREASKRTVNMRHFDVQLIGGKVLHDGKIAEMKTGEGKTLVATLAAYVNALNNKSVHIVTVNDYLATRDSEWMGKIYKFLGLTVGCITSNTNPEDRPREYSCDIVYATNNEIGFDYLRDNLKNDYDKLCFKKNAFAIVDEVDSILIDEARTPLVISAESNTKTDLYPVINKIVKFLDNNHFEINEESKSILLTTEGMEFSENLLIKNGLINKGTLQDLENVPLNHNILQSLRANKLFAKDKDYIINNNNIVIIDELTGRPMEGRRYGDGLHQAIEAKEGLKIQKENQTIASITYQNFFRTYEKLSGMTGTAKTEAKEFEGIYNLEVVDIPPNIKVNRLDKNDQIYMSKKEKYDAVIELVKSRNKDDQPILIGTTSVENSELISSLLIKENIKHNVLNAKNHQKEAEIIQDAGMPGNVTISTNMAGRGTDIKLGNNNDELKQKVIESGGLLVIGTERHESRRIDNQLRGRSGRQGDIGESIFFLSLEDDLMRIFGSKTLESVLSKLGLKEGEVITHSMITKSLERAQQKVESHNYDLRKQILKFDDILNDQRKIIYENRKGILKTNDQSKIIEEMIDDFVENIVAETIPPKKYSNEWNPELLKSKSKEIFNLELPISKWFEEEGVDEIEIKKRLHDEIKQKYLEKKHNYSSELLKFAEKRVMLFQLDKDWRDHLAAMDSLRSSVNLRAMGGKDPFYEYKRESFDYFDEMLSNQNERVLKTLFNIQLISNESADNTKNKNQEKRRIISKKVGRNETCPCGSGKKYKQCHGA